MNVHFHPSRIAFELTDAKMPGHTTPTTTPRPAPPPLRRTSRRIARTLDGLRQRRLFAEEPPAVEMRRCGGCETDIPPSEEILVQPRDPERKSFYMHRRCAVCEECGLGAGPHEPFVINSLSRLKHRMCCKCNKCGRVCSEKQVYLAGTSAYHRECRSPADNSR